MGLGNDSLCTIQWRVEIKIRCDAHHKNGTKHPMAQRWDRSTLNGESYRVYLFTVYSIPLWKKYEARGEETKIVATAFSWTQGDWCIPAYRREVLLVTAADGVLMEEQCRNHVSCISGPYGVGQWTEAAFTASPWTSAKTYKVWALGRLLGLVDF